MNLVGDKWVPVIGVDGRKILASLHEVFADGEDFSDLAVRPPQRVALMRLLICIAQTALQGPEDYDDWRTCKRAMQEKAVAYLTKHRDSFNLFGDNAFLQVSDISADNDLPYDKFDHGLASGNNAVLFDQSATSEGRNFPIEWLPLNILAFLNFSAGGKVGKVSWQKLTNGESTFAAPALKYAHAFIKSSTVIDTIHQNTIPLSLLRKQPNFQLGKPVWEMMPQGPDDEKAFANAFHTYLGRLAPLSRIIKIADVVDGCYCNIGPVPKKYRIDHLPAHREPSATVVMNKKEEPRYLMLSSGKHFWRDLGSALVLKKSETVGCGALALQGIRENSETINFDIWVGGLATGASEAKLADEMEWGFSIERDMLDEPSVLSYQDGVEKANTAARNLRSAVHKAFKDMKAVSTPAAVCETFYWSLLDREYEVLFGAANKINESLFDKWVPIVKKMQRKAFDSYCPSETPRQLKSYITGLNELEKLNNKYLSKMEEENG